MNWDLLSQQQQQTQQRMGDNVDREKSPFIKFTQGTHHIRPLPVGNYEDNIPYKVIKQHTIQKNSDGKKIPYFALCWNWLMEPSQRENTLTPLGKMQKLTKADFGLWQKYGCPFCRAIKALDAAGYDKQFGANLAAKATNMWNVIKRASPNTQEADALFVWSMSNKLHNQFRDMLIESHSRGMDILDPTTGFDWIVSATGEQLQRRYTLSMWPQPKPITGDIVPFNLMEIAARSFRTYQATIDLLKEGAGVPLGQIGYIIPADQTFENMTNTVPVEPVQPVYSPPPAVLPQSNFHVPTAQYEVPSPQVQQQRQQVMEKQTVTAAQVGRTEISDDGELIIDGVRLF